MRITAKVVGRLPVPGAANVRVRDVIYGTERDRYRYVFTAEFTVGVVGPKHRVARVATFSEPRARVGGQSGASSVETGSGSAPTVILAPEGGTLVEQYRRLAPAAAKSADRGVETSGGAAGDA